MITIPSQVSSIVISPQCWKCIWIANQPSAIWWCVFRSRIFSIFVTLLLIVVGLSFFVAFCLNCLKDLHSIWQVHLWGLMTHFYAGPWLSRGRRNLVVKLQAKTCSCFRLMIYDFWGASINHLLSFYFSRCFKYFFLLLSQDGHLLCKNCNGNYYSFLTALSYLSIF